MFFNRALISIFALLIIALINQSAHGQSAPASDTGKDSLMSHSITIIDLPQNDTNYVSLVKPPLSRKIRSGFVTLAPGVAGEEHATEAYEEIIVILSGQAVLHSENGDSNISFGQVAYVPPHTKHFMKNDGGAMLKYIYIVTKTE